MKIRAKLHRITSNMSTELQTFNNKLTFSMASKMARLTVEPLKYHKIHVDSYKA